VALLGPKARKLLTGSEFSQALGLRSLRFTVCVLSLAGATRQTGGRLRLHGFLRGIGGVVLQQRQRNGSWRQVARVHARPNGRFEVVVRRPRFAAAYRLAVDQVAGPPLEPTARG